MATVRIRSFRRAISFAYSKYFRPYGQPLASSVVFNYIKQYLPLILLGQMTTFSNVAYYRVIASITDLGMEFFPSVAQSMLPSVVESHERDRAAFGARFARHGAVYLVAMGLALVVFSFGHPLILALYDLRTTPEISTAELLASLAVMQASLGFLLNFLFQIGGDTKAMYFMSPAHNIIYALSIVALAPYLVIGMMVARLAQRAAGTIMLTDVVVLRMRYLSGPQYASLLALTLGMSVLMVAAYFASAVLR
jgi:O-antigen/teichoic acid export membrane protein